MYQFKKFAVLVFVLLLAFPLLASCRSKGHTHKNLPYATSGILDLAGWDFKTDGSIRLDGQWEFYWNKLLIPQQFTISKTDMSTVPSPWKSTVVRGDELPDDEGYATYRLLVKMDNIPRNAALNLKFVISSCKLWVDNKMVYASGIVGNSAKNHKGKFTPQVIPIAPEMNQFYITLQISNFGYASGGFITSIELGDMLTIVSQKNTRSFGDMFLFGSIMIMGLYHLTLFLLRRKEFYTLYFSILCFLISIRTLLMGEMLLYNFIPDIPLYIFLKISSSTLSLGLPFFVMFIHSFFPEDTPYWFVRISQIVGVLFTTITLTVNDKLSSLFLMPFQICGVLIIVLILFILSKAAYLKRDASHIFLIATISIVFITINDTLNGYGIIKTGFYIPIGLFLFIFVQSFMLFRKLVKQEELLLRSELRMLQAQIKPHFLFNALNTIISVSRSSSEKTIQLLLYLSDYLRCGFSFKNDEEFVDFDTEILHVKSYLEIEKARFSDKLNIVYEIDNNIECKVPPYILQPLVENAVRHGILPLKNGGTVRLSVKKTDNMLYIVIEDNGVGMTEEKLNSILNGTDKTSGIGLSNVKGRIQRIYKRKIKIESAIGKGTIICITIPII
ncbi:MAG TPA: 7TM diverse intracellular signaling domain-containing protein [Pseudobacteroides sp.]|uniref:sensor histidine kinase n=1 Tax=Pseudobacteroides sp. TaxID=1968840 RepID=UPI002F92940B